MLQRLRRGDVLLGLCNMYPAAGIIEGMCRGWDFAWIDGQHGQMSYDAALAGVRAASATGLESVLRVPGHDPGMLGLFADMCPSAVMVPMVNDTAQADQIVKAVRFAPRGNRSYGGRRPIDLYGRSYHDGTEPLLIAQIETLAAVKAAADIAQVDGVDLLFFGADDIKVLLGLPIDASPFEHEQLRQLLTETASAARAAGRFAGCIATSGPALTAAVEMGYQLIVCGGDSGILRAGAQAKLNEARAALNQPTIGTTPTSQASSY